MPTKPVTAAVYLRVSLDATGDQLAVQRQREDCLKMCDARGWKVAEVYTDNSISATDARKVRPDYDRMVDDYKRGTFSALVCWDLDRLTRQPRQLEDWIDAAEQRGLRLVTANGEADLTTDGGRMYARIKAAVARAEVERKGARQARAHRQRAEQGRPPKGVRLTGYTLTGELIPAEADMVRKVFERFAAGDSLRGIAAALTADAVPTRTGGRKWNPSTVRGLLTNARYAGRSTFKGDDTGQAGTWPAIVPAETFDAVQTILDDPRRATNHRGTDKRWLGSGLYLCGVCGRPVHGWTGGRYRCPDGCVNRSGSQVDPYIEALVRERLSRPDLAELLARPGDSAALADLNGRLERLRGRLVTIAADYDAGLIDGRRFKVATDKAEAEVRDVVREQGALLAASGPSSVLAAEDRAAAYDAAPVMIQQRVVRALIPSIRLMPGVRGSKVFRPESVVFRWANEPEDTAAAKAIQRRVSRTPCPATRADAYMGVVRPSSAPMDFPE